MTETEETILMLCAFPVTIHVNSKPQLVGCGQCLNCNINKRREWVGRILLEGTSCEKNHESVSWITLTYDEDSVPLAQRGRGSDPEATLRPHDYQLLFKRLRKRSALGPFRFALVGEYGDKTNRPHYHAMLFGPDPLKVERTLKDQWNSLFGFSQVREWRQGTRGDDASLARAQYLSNYVTKKMTTVDSPKLGVNRVPEFFRASHSLGWSNHLIDLCTTYGGSQEIVETGDVPRSVRLSGKVYPIARPLRERLRDELSIPQTRAEREQLVPSTRERPEPTFEAYAEAKRKHDKLMRRKPTAVL